MDNDKAKKLLRLTTQQYSRCLMTKGEYAAEVRSIQRQAAEYAAQQRWAADVLRIT